MSSSGTTVIGEVRGFQLRLIRGILRALVVLGLLAAAAGTYDSIVNQEYWTIPVFWVAYGVILGLALWPGAPYAVQVGALLVLVYGIGMQDFMQDGLSGSARVFMLVLPFLAGLFFRRRASVLVLIVSTLSMAVYGWAFVGGRLAVPGEAASAEASGWISGTISFLMLGGLMTVSLDSLVPRLAQALGESRKLAGELEQERQRLAERVADQTTALERRSMQLQTAAEVARDAALIQEVGSLFEGVVKLVSERFGFYHCGIFMLDERGEHAVLRAASSEGGQRMLARGHRLRVGEMGIVGYVTGSGEARVALDVGADATYFNNPDLPETRSEMALPLKARDRVIGALDVQSREPAAFGRDEVELLQAMADQIAVAIDNAQLRQQAEASLEAQRRAFGQLSREAWRELLRAESEFSERYDPRRVLPAGTAWTAEMQWAAQSGENTIRQDESSTSLAIPLKLHGQVVGVLNAHKATGASGWSRDETALLETLSEQLGLALESARLYQETQRRAAREQLAGAVTTRLRQSLDVQEVLRTAADEIRQALALPEVTIRLNPPETAGGGNGQQGAARGQV